MGMISHYLNRIYNLLTSGILSPFAILYSILCILKIPSSLRGEPQSMKGTTLESVTGLILRYLLTPYSLNLKCLSPVTTKNKYSLKDQRPESNPFTSASLTPIHQDEDEYLVILQTLSNGKSPSLSRLLLLSTLNYAFLFSLCLRSLTRSLKLRNFISFSPYIS